jgi:hypothetical protein
MSLYSQIVEIYPELAITDQHDEFQNGSIRLQDDGDGIEFIAKWEYTKPIPEGMKIGK